MSVGYSHLDTKVLRENHVRVGNTPGVLTNATADLVLALTLTTAYLRVRAGKHYPSDVIAGLVVGTGISLLNAYIHENRQ
jgi:hypothetical protein